MDIATVQENVRGVVNEIDCRRFIYQLLLAYGKPKASITLLEKGAKNLSKNPGEVVWKKTVWFRGIHGDEPVKTGVVRESVSNEYDLHALADQLRKSDEVTKHGLRFVIVTDYKTLLAVDTKTAETLDVPIKELDKHAHFFLPWAGHEKHKSQNESEADIKAAYKMAKLYDQICKDNPEITERDSHSLNVFLSRVLFCFFAEDTDIFPTEGMFTTALKSHTAEDGGDLDSYLDRLFDALSKDDPQRKGFASYLTAFPYVNGGLFSTRLKAPTFSRQSRKLLLECGDLDWSEINPDIFGSMMQAVVHSDQRGETGMHYTSVSNIMKVIEPLFLNDLRNAFEQSKDNAKALERLRNRLATIKVFDPACGSGNFLVIAFKELRKLEIEIYLRLRELNPQYQPLFILPQIQLTQFHGIELDDFAHEIATLSLWLAEHQMNVKFKEKLKVFVPALPLKPSGQIVAGNATTLDWHKICPSEGNSEIYVLGNPPYSGSRNQTKAQKEEMKEIFSGWDSYKDLDYIACWFVKGAEFIEGTNAKLAFVSTNSICQGTQVALLWPFIFGKSLEISFAYRPFKWQNNAKHNAGVTVTIIGLRKISNEAKLIFDTGSKLVAENINGYLSNARNIAVERSSEPISKLPKMYFGSMPNDGGNLILSTHERNELIEKYPAAAGFIKRFIGSQEFINGQQRWCLMISDNQVDTAKMIPPIAARLERISQIRSKSTEKSTRALAPFPHRFYFSAHQEGQSIIVPSVSSERREYVPIGFLDSETVINNLAYAVYQAEPWLFAVLSSKMHNVWVRAVGGRLEERIRYSVGICYSTFPMPDLTDKQKETLATHAVNVLSERERHPEKTIAQLYDPTTMPRSLADAHKDLDLAVERCYRSKPFADDAQRLEYLFELYEEMIAHA